MNMPDRLTIKDPCVQELEHELRLHQVMLEIQNLELRETHRQLEELRGRYTELYDYAPVGYVTLDAKACVKDINLTCATLLGKDRARVVGKPLMHYVVRRDAHRLLQYLRQCSQSARKVTGEIRLSQNDGSSRHVGLCSTTFRDSAGRMGYRVTVTDRSDYKLMETALERQTQDAARGADTLRQHTGLLQSVLESMTDAVVVADAQGEILFINPPAERIHRQVHLMGETCPAPPPCGLYRDERGAGYPPQDLPLARALRGETVDDAEIFLNHPAWPQGLWLTAHARPLQDDTGALCGGMAIFRDIATRDSLPG